MFEEFPAGHDVEPPVRPDQQMPSGVMLPGSSSEMWHRWSIGALGGYA